MKKITAIGEILFDVYTDKKKLGGAPFNFIYHIINITGNGAFISRVGDDEFGKEILDFLHKKNISTEYVQIDEKHSTGVAKPVLDDSKVPDWEIAADRAYDFISLNEKIENLIINETGCCYYGTLAQREETSRNTIQSLFNKNIKYFCDLNIRQKFYSKDIIGKCLHSANVLKINLDELKLINELLFKIPFNEKLLVDQLIAEYSINLICITKGEGGSNLYTSGEENFYKASVDRIVDTVGAGDAYASILCIGYLNNWPLEKTNRLAAEFAAEVVKIHGAIPAETSFYNSIKQKIKIDEKKFEQ